MRKLERIARSNKYLLLSVLMLIGAIIFVVINQVDYLSKFSTAIVALALLVPSIILAGLGFYQTATVPLRWASMATVVVSAVVLIFVASSLITSLSNDGARDENGIAKEADALAPARAEAEGKKDQEGATETSTPTKAQSQAEVSMPVLFRNVNIFDGVNEELAMGMNVLVVDNLISQISAEELVVAANTLIIDGEGRTLIPGLHDQHVHFSMFNPLSDGERQNMTPFHVGAVASAHAERILLNGFTTVRDMGGPSKYLQRVVDAGVVPGPRIFPSENYITQTSGHADLRKLNDRHPELSGQGPDHWFETDVSFIADGPDAIRMAVRENLRRGATQIKIMGSGGVTSEFDPLHSVQYQPEEIQMAVKTAAQWETYVAAHVFTEKAIFNVIDNGVQVLEHIPFLTEEAAE